MKDTSDSNRELRAREIFMEAMNIPDLSSRGSHIAQACQGNAELEKEVHALLQAFSESEPLFERDPYFQQLQKFDEIIGSRIDRYEVIEKMGEGGFGEVFRVEQSEPIRRELALKIIKPGMDSREIIKRFEAERQALAMMRHPNIAQIIDAGATDSGRPYFVMELAIGLPITKYCNEHRLTIRERLYLFLKVCDALQHAHQQGIIHRDLKPSNIVVVENDHGPEPKVIDFGIAKSLQTRLTDQTVVSQKAVLIGTPEFMSPEQLMIGSEAVDTRSDIYSLGILLYELTVGTRPFEEELRSADLPTINRIISSKEPTRPTVQLQKLGVKLEKVLRDRNTDRHVLTKTLHGDLEWIMLKAIDKEPERRYQAVSSLAEDIRRYLEFKPVEAMPPSTLYLLGKYIRRNRTFVFSAAIIFLSLLAGLIVSVYSLQREQKQRVLAEEARERAQSIVQFLIEDLEPQLVEVGKRETLKDVVRTVVLYYEKLPPEMQDIKTIREHARALKILGDASHWNFPAEFTDHEGDLLEWTLSESWSLWEQVAKANPDDSEAAVEAQFAKSYLQCWVPDNPLYSPPENDGDFEKIYGEFHELEKRFPDNLSLNIAMIRMLRGNSFLTEDIDKKAAWAGEACKRGQRMMELYPDSDRAKAEYCTSLHIQAVWGIILEQGPREEYLQNYLTGHEITKKLLQNNPSHWGYLVQAYAMVDYYVLWELREDYRAEVIPIALDYNERMQIIQPANALFKKNAGQMYNAAGRLAELDLRKDDQLRYYQAAMKNWEITADKKGEEHPDFRERFVQAIGSVGRSAAELGLKEQALSCLDRLEQLKEQGGELEKHVTGQQIAVFMALGNWASAQNLLIEKIEKLNAAEEFEGKEAEIAYLKGNLGDVFYAAGEFVEARSYYEEVIRDLDPDRQLQREEIFAEFHKMSVQNFACTLLLSGEHERAIELLEWVYNQYDQHVHKLNGLLRSRLRLANAAFLLAEALGKAGSEQDARRQELLRQAAEVLDNPENKPRLRPEDVLLRQEIEQRLTELNERA